MNIKDCNQLNELIRGIFNPSVNSMENLVNNGILTEEEIEIIENDAKNINDVPNVDRQQLDFVFDGVTSDIKIKKLINIFGIQGLFDLYKQFKRDLIPSLIYDKNAPEGSKFTNFEQLGVVNTKINKYKEELTEGANTSEATKKTLLSNKYDRKTSDINDKTKIYHTFNDLINLFGDGVIVVDKGTFKLKFESGLKSGAFRADDSFANGTKEIPAFAKMYLSTLEDENGNQIDFVNVQAQFAKLQNFPFFNKLNVNNVYDYIDRILAIKNNKGLFIKAIEEHILEMYPNIEVGQLALFTKHYNNFIQSLDDNFNKIKEVNSFLRTMNNDINNIKDENLNSLYRNLHTSIFNAVSTVSGQKYATLIYDPKEKVYKEDITGEYKQDYAQIVAESINSTTKALSDYENVEERNEILNMYTPETIIRNFLGLDWSKVKDDFFNKMDIEQRDSFENELMGNSALKIRGELNTLRDDFMRVGDIKYNTSKTKFEQLIRYKQIMETNTPKSVYQNISGDAVPAITLTSNMQRFMLMVGNLIDRNYEMYKENPFVNGDLQFEFVVAGGIDNGKDITEYKKLSRQGQVNHDIVFKYWNNLKNGYVQFLPYEYSDKSKNPYVKLQTTNIHSGNINDYSKVIDLLYKSQETIYNGQVNGMINQITDIINYSTELDIKSIPIPTDYESLKTTYQYIRDKKLQDRIIRLSSDMISKGIDVSPFFKNVNDTFQLDKTFTDEIETLKDRTKYENSLKRQIIKDALYGFSTGFKFDDYIDKVKPAGIASFKDYKVLFNTDKMTSEQIKELKEAIKTNVDAYINKDIDGLFARVNPMFKRYAYDWQLVSVNMTQMSEGLVNQYKGKTIHAKWLDSTKRNVFPFANGQAFTFGLKNGLPEFSYAAVVNDPTQEIFNILGNYKNQDSEDGVELITEEFLEYARNSVGRNLGNEIGIVLKTINTGFDYNLGVAQKDKNASHTILGETVRRSSETLQKLSNLYDQMKYSNLIGNPVTVTIPEHTYAVKEYDVKTNTFNFKVITKAEQPNVPVDSMLDIRNYFGEGLLGFDTVVEDNNGDIEANGKRYRYANSRDNQSSTQLIINQIESQLAEIDPRLKGFFISVVPYTSSRKSGGANINEVNALTDGNLLISKQTNHSRLVQLNAYHEIDDHADITIASQITGAAGFNAHTQENKDNATKLYQSYADLIDFTLREEIPNINDTLSQKGKEFIIKLLEDKTSDLDTINMTSQILSFYGKENIGDVLKSQYVSNKISSSINSKLSELIQFKLNGFQAIMGANLTEVYRTDDGKLYNYQNAKLMQEAGVKMSKDRLQAQQFDLIGDVGSVSMYKTKTVIEQFIVRNNGNEDYKKGSEIAYNKLAELAAKLNIQENDKRIEAIMQEQLNSIVKGELTPVEYYDNYSIQQLHEDLKNEKVSVDEILAKLSTTSTINVSSYNGKPAEIIVPFKWAKQYGIKIGTDINDINVDYFVKQIQDLQKTNPDELQKMINHFTKEYGISDINDIANKQYQSFQKALEVIVGRINKLVSSINSLNSVETQNG